MNRNVESHFAHIPKLDMQRSIFDRSSGLKTSFNVGELIPIYLQEVLPGDTVKMTSSKVVRLQTLLTPIYDNLYLDVYWFFVPNRLVWEHWREFCGENTQSPWKENTTYKIPNIINASGWPVGSVADYLGIPPDKPITQRAGFRISALPFRAYALIATEFFRDENLTYPLEIPKGDSTQNCADVDEDNYIEATAFGFAPFKVAKYHDRFTSALPSPSKGDPVTFPLLSGQMAPVMTRSEVIPNFGMNNGDPIVFAPSASVGSFENMRWRAIGGYGSSLVNPGLGIGATFGDGQDYTDTGESHGVEVKPVNLWADLSTSVGSVTVNELRLAFQLQRFYERQARGGTRYIEILKSFFGVTSPDARLQRPEYLGGNRIPLNVNQVSNTSQAEKAFLGDVGANSVTSDVHRDFIHSFTEHGYLYGVACARYDHTYSGIDRHWTRELFTDFYWPTFANLGEMPIRNYEVFYDPNASNKADVFGYQEAWSEYRYAENKVTGEMRPNVPNTLASWHLADDYETIPTLSDEWIREDKTNVDRVLAVTSKVSNQIFADMYFKCFWTRPMPVYSVPGLIDHH